MQLVGVLPLMFSFVMSRGKKDKKLNKENNQRTVTDEVSASKTFLSLQDYS